MHLETPFGVAGLAREVQAVEVKARQASASREEHCRGRDAAIQRWGKASSGAHAAVARCAKDRVRGDLDLHAPQG